MEVKFKKLHENAKPPFLATIGSGCYDVCSSNEWVFDLMDRRIHKLGTGLAFQIPMGYLLEIRPRSGLSLKGVSLINSPGTLDADYRGELFILLRNVGNQTVTIKKGDRIAQVRLVSVLYPFWVEVEELSATERGLKGFGSSDD